MIRTSFPELEEQKIIIGYKNMGNAYFLFETNQAPLYKIFVNNDVKRHPLEIARGGIAHELCHFVNRLNLSEYMRKKDEELYRKNPLYRKLDERNTDLQTILRGYGKELLALNSLKRVSSMADGGLTPEEIKKLLKL